MNDGYILVGENVPPPTPPPQTKPKKKKKEKKKGASIFGSPSR